MAACKVCSKISLRPRDALSTATDHNSKAIDRIYCSEAARRHRITLQFPLQDALRPSVDVPREVTRQPYKKSLFENVPPVVLY